MAELFLELPNEEEYPDYYEEVMYSYMSSVSSAGDFDLLQTQALIKLVFTAVLHLRLNRSQSRLLSILLIRRSKMARMRHWRALKGISI